MARKYIRWSTDAWSDDDWLGLDTDAQWLYVVVASDPQLNLLGVIGLQPRRWASCADDMTPQRVLSAFGRLVAGNFLVHDPATEEVWVRALLHYDRALANRNLAKAAARQLKSVRSGPLRTAILASVPERYLEAITKELTVVRPNDERWSNQTPNLPKNENPLSSVVTTQAVAEAVDNLARADLDAATRRGLEIRNRSSYLQKLRSTRLDVDGDRLRLIAVEHPDWSSGRLVEALERKPPAIQEYIPEGVGNGWHPDRDSAP